MCGGKLRPQPFVYIPIMELTLSHYYHKICIYLGHMLFICTYDIYGMHYMVMWCQMCLFLFIMRAWKPIHRPLGGKSINCLLQQNNFLKKLIYQIWLSRNFNLNSPMHYPVMTTWTYCYCVHALHFWAPFIHAIVMYNVIYLVRRNTQHLQHIQSERRSRFGMVEGSFWSHMWLKWVGYYTPLHNDMAWPLY